MSALSLMWRSLAPIATSLEMAGASITMMHLDDELQTLIDHPCDCACSRVVCDERRTYARDLVEEMRLIADRLAEARDELCRLDG